MGYTYNRDDVLSYAHGSGISTHVKGNELTFKYCPYCGGGDHRDKDTFSINLDTGAYCCLRGSCGRQGHFVQLARDFGFPLDFGEIKKYRQYPKNKYPEPKTESTAIRYMQSRGISADITNKYMVFDCKGRPNIICFGFYDADKQLKLIKYRNTTYEKGKGSKEWFDTNCQPILFGMMQAVEQDKPLIITEGQIDSLSVAECGIPNAVSVPGGCRNFNWYGHCSDWLNGFPELIVFGDYEHDHITLVDELFSLVNIPVRCVRREDYLGEKDANAILTKYGKAAVIDAVKNAEMVKAKQIKRLATVEKIDMANQPRIRTGIATLDREIGGLFFGSVTLLSGKRGEGKSTLGSQFIAEAIEQKYPVFIYSGELPNYHFKNWLDMQIAGTANLKKVTHSTGGEYYSVPDDISAQINAWYYDKAFIYDNTFIPDDKAETEGLLDIAVTAIRQYGCKLIFIDNLMTAIDCEPTSDIYRAQSEFLKKLSRLSKKYDVAVLLIAHPKKHNGDFDNDTVSGSADITNAVDNVMYFKRVNSKPHSAELGITKNRLFGKLLQGNDAIPLDYIPSCRRLKETNVSGEKVYKGVFAVADNIPDELPWD